MFFRKLKTLLFLVAFLNITTHSSGQDLVNSELLSLFDADSFSEQQFTKPLEKSYSEFDIILSLGFLFYKTIISSQDNPSCVFTPSCSEYAVESFYQKGVLGGWVHTFDRLSRCHSFVNTHHYHFEKKKKRFYDPVK